MTPETRTRVDVLKIAAEALVAAADELVDQALALETAELPPGTRVQHSEAPIGEWDGRGTVVGPALSGHVLVDWDNVVGTVAAGVEFLTPIPQRSWVCGNHAVEVDFDRGPEDFNPYPTFTEWSEANGGS